MNNFKRISAIILVFCTAATILASCGKDNKTDVATAKEEVITEIITEYITKKEQVTVEVTDKKGEVSVSVSEKVVTVPITKIITVTQNETTDKKPKKTTKKSDTIQISSVTNQITAVAQTQNQSVASITNNPIVTPSKNEIKTTVSTTKRPVIDDIINEKAVGMFMMTKTDPVHIGNHATIVIQGTPSKTYSIEFYETPENVSKQSSLEDKKADANGFVTWTFKITNACNLGKRKIVVKEKNSTNYLETSITVK